MVVVEADDLTMVWVEVTVSETVVDTVAVSVCTLDSVTVAGTFVVTVVGNLSVIICVCVAPLVKKDDVK